MNRLSSTQLRNVFWARPTADHDFTAKPRGREQQGHAQDGDTICVRFTHEKGFPPMWDVTAVRGEPMALLEGFSEILQLVNYLHWLGVTPKVTTK